MLNKKHWSLSALNRLRDRIDTNPDYQRPYVWGPSQKQLLIDTILRDYDVPKLYLHQKSEKEYEVIDGQQRIRTIWDFYDDKFAISSSAEPVKGYNVAGLKFSELDTDIQLLIDMYELDFAVISNCTEDEIREMFLRLQNGTSLKAQEIRNAMPGNMRDYVKKVANHPFFKKVDFDNKRFVHDHVAAQLCLLTINGKICNIKDRDLNKMYKENTDFDGDSKTAKSVTKTLNYMNSMFDGKAPELKRYNVVSLFALIQDLQENYVVADRNKELANWFIDFEKRRALDKLKDTEEQDPILVAYHEKTSHSTDGIESLLYRHNTLKEDLIEHIEHLQMKDPKRAFDETQKQVIFRRDGGICKMCGVKCEWNGWEADHIVPWNRGGQTEIENGQVLCPTCNSKKSDNMIVRETSPQ
jgi:5-methylcytosine-specific restriction endonuclease McrA